MFWYPSSPPFLCSFFNLVLFFLSQFSYESEKYWRYKWRGDFGDYCLWLFYTTLLHRAHIFCIPAMPWCRQAKTAQLSTTWGIVMSCAWYTISFLVAFFKKKKIIFFNFIHFLRFLIFPPSFSQLCSLVSLQRYTKALSSMQRASLVEKSRQKPQDRMQTLTDVSFPQCLLCIFFISWMVQHLCSLNLAGFEKLLIWWGPCACSMWYIYREATDTSWWSYPWNPKGKYISSLFLAEK